MKHLSILIFAWLACAALGLAREPVRLAISTDPAFAKEADLITVELSKSKDIVLLERQQILKIADEHALHAGKTDDDIKLGQLLGADGLLILSSTEIDGRKLLSARLVAVHLGVVIDEWISPPYEADEGRAMPLFFSHRIEPLLQKLRVARKDAVPVSVAGLFAAVDSPELRSIERELTWLLIHRLTKEPSVFVLERRKMEDLVWEKYLIAEKPKPFLSGAVIVEGKLESRDGKLDLALGLRRPGEKKAKPSNVTGAADDLPAFAEKIVVAIMDGLKLKPAERRWDLAAEAAVYADQAEWAMDHRMIDLCIASAESAWALGRRDTDLARLRIIAYSLAAYPFWRDIPGEGARRGGLNIGDGGSELDQRDPAKALAAAIRAMEISADCLIAELPPSRRVDRTLRPVVAQALYYTSLLIWQHHLAGNYQPYAEQLSHLRSLVHHVYTELAKTPEPRAHWETFSIRKDSQTIQAFAAYAPFWYDTNEEVLNCYRRLLKPVRHGEDRDEMLKNITYLKAHWWEPSFMPWVVAWNPAETRARQMDMLQRLKQLTESSDFDDQAVGWASLQWLITQAARAKPTENDLRWPQDYAAVLAGKSTAEQPKKIIRNEILEFLWNEREQVSSCRSTAIFYIMRSAVREADHDFRLRYLRYMLDDGRPILWVLYEAALDELKLTEVESIEFQQFCTAARDKLQARGDFDVKEDSLQAINGALKELVKGSPPPKPKSKPSRPTKATPAPQASIPPLVVSRYWYARSSDNYPELKMGFSSLGSTYEDGKLWEVFYSQGSVDYLCSVALDSFITEQIAIPPPRRRSWTHAPLITKDAVYLLSEKENLKWDRQNRRWSVLDLPGYPYRARALGDSLYLQYEFGSKFVGIDLKNRSSAGSGILRLDPSNDRPIFLASSRRRPAETILDAREPYIPQALFSGADGEVSAALEFLSSGERKIFRTTAAGDWEEIMGLPNENISQVHFKPVNDGILAFMHPRGSPHTFFQAVFFGADGGPAEILLSNSKPPDPPAAILPGSPRWDTSSKSNPIDFWKTEFDYCDGRLYQMKRVGEIDNSNDEKNAHPTTQLILTAYTPGHRLPVTIPMKFELSEADKTQIIDFEEAERVGRVKAVPEGIVVFGKGRIGFWLVTKKELEEWIEHNRKKQGE